MVSHLGIQYLEIGDDYLRASMPVDHRTRQPLHLLHGGASCVLSETLGSIAANMTVNSELQYAVGLEINANHIRSARDGETVIGHAHCLHLGKTTQVWETKIFNASEKLVCISRLTMSILDRDRRPEKDSFPSS